MRWALRGTEQGRAIGYSCATRPCTLGIHYALHPTPQSFRSPPHVTPRVCEDHTWHGHAEALDAFEPLLLFTLRVLALVPVYFGVRVC